MPGCQSYWNFTVFKDFNNRHLHEIKVFYIKISVRTTISNCWRCLQNFNRSKLMLLIFIYILPKRCLWLILCHYLLNIIPILYSNSIIISEISVVYLNIIQLVIVCFIRQIFLVSQIRAIKTCINQFILTIFLYLKFFGVRILLGAEAPYYFFIEHAVISKLF